jgi:hypothetical protein
MRSPSTEHLGAEPKRGAVPTAPWPVPPAMWLVPVLALLVPVITLATTVAMVYADDACVGGRDKVTFGFVCF